jgi:hypothetical protein
MGAGGSPGEDVREGLPGGLEAPRVFVSHAHDDEEHEDRVRRLWHLLRANGTDARLDLPAAEERQDWTEWMTRQVRDADRVLVVASPEYRRRAEGDAEPGEGRQRPPRRRSSDRLPAGQLNLKVVLRNQPDRTCKCYDTCCPESGTVRTAPRSGGFGSVLAIFGTHSS